MSMTPILQRLAEFLGFRGNRRNARPQPRDHVIRAYGWVERGVHEGLGDIREEGEIRLLTPGHFVQWSIVTRHGVNRRERAFYTAQYPRAHPVVATLRFPAMYDHRVVHVRQCSSAGPMLFPRRLHATRIKIPNGERITIPFHGHVDDDFDSLRRGR